MKRALGSRGKDDTSCTRSIYENFCIALCASTNVLFYVRVCACVFSLWMCICAKANIHECVCWIRLLKLSVHWPL